MSILHSAALTKEEAAWIKKLQKVLDSCPSERMASFTIGDSDITLYDTTFDPEINEYMNSHTTADFCTAVESIGCAMYTLNMPFAVHSIAG